MHELYFLVSPWAMWDTIICILLWHFSWPLIRNDNIYSFLCYFKGVI